MRNASEKYGAPLGYLSIVVSLLLALNCRAQSFPENICSNYFSYVQEAGSWYGELTLPSLDLGTHHVDMNFTQRGRPDNSDVGDLLPYPSQRAARDNMGRNRPIKFRVRLRAHRGTFPKISKFALNGQTLCQGDEYPDWNWHRYYDITEIRAQTAFFETSGYRFRAQNEVRYIDACCQTVEENRPPTLSQQLPVYRTRTEDLPAVPFLDIRQLPWQRSQPQPQPRPQPQPPLQRQSQSLPQPEPTPALPTPMWAALPTPVSTRVNTQQTAATCGIESAGSPLIYNGDEVTQGRFPWLTAIYYKEGSALQYKCSGTLVSSRYVITAAHCVVGKSASQLLAWVGKHNLHSFSEKGAHDIDSVQGHPEYNAATIADADVAALSLILEVILTPLVRPICIWDENESIELKSNEKGFVAGWGQDEKGNEMTKTPHIVDAKLVNENECRREFGVQDFITSRTLCAGDLDGSGPCRGDSGGGLMIFRNGRWLLRGIVSFGQSKMGKCDHSNYVLYCDLAKHIDWVKRKLS